MAIDELDEPAPPHPRRERARPRTRRVTAAIIAGVVVAALAITGGWVVTHPQRVADQFTVWQFEPSSTITDYANRSTMTDEGTFLFYASQPTVEPKTTFDGFCASQAEGVGILGCYVGADKRIYLFDVTDKRLDGLEEVVAAHEMLHAAWDRMSADDRSALAPLLEEAAAAKAKDPAFASRLAYYDKAEPGERLNELHSIVGTEFADLPPMLESHYALYFKDRAALVTLHETSNAVFTTQQEAIDSIVAQLDALKAGVDADYASYNSGYDELNSDIAQFNQRAQSGDFTSQARFNSERADLLARQAELDTLYSSIDERKNQYEGLVAQLNDLNAQVDELNKSINIAPRSENAPAG